MRRKMTRLASILAGLAGLATAGFCGSAMAQYVQPSQIETASFGEDSFAIGTLSASDGALPRELWRGARADQVSFLLENLPERYSDPAWADILRRTLLSPGDGPQGADTALTGQKVMALAIAGYYTEAAELARFSGGLQSEPALSQAIAYADMMDGDMAGACGRGASLREGRGTPFWLKMRLICYGINGEQAAADLTFGLLSEKGLLNSRERDLFQALISGTKPAKTIPPLSGFEYVAVRELKLPVPLARLDDADGAVLRALANEEDAPAQARVYAAERALYYGIMPAEEVRGLFAGFDFPVERVGEAETFLKEKPDNFLTDAIVYQAVQNMAAPELTLERTALIGDALRAADSLQRYTALSKIYAPAARELEVIVNYAPYAEEFALAGILAEDHTVADRWILALAQDQTKPEGLERARALLNVMAVRDYDAAAQIGRYAGIDVKRPAAPDPATLPLAESGNGEVIAELVDIALDRDAAGAQGLNALMVLVALQAEARGELEEIRQKILLRSLNNAGMTDILNELDFDKAATEFVQKFASRADRRAALAPAGDSMDGGYPVATGAAAGVTPRVKPALANG